jgi:hypothetical protein
VALPRTLTVETEVSNLVMPVSGGARAFKKHGLSMVYVSFKSEFNQAPFLLSREEMLYLIRLHDRQREEHSTWRAI